MTPEQLSKANEISKKITDLLNHADGISRQQKYWTDRNSNRPNLKIDNNNYGGIELMSEFLPISCENTMTIYLSTVERKIAALREEIAEL